ncbi:hypothetical protein Tco_1465101 [Tanacetum coccineum]
MCRLVFRSTLNGIIRMVIVQECYEGQDIAPLPPRDQRHLWLRYQDLAERMRMVYTGDDGQEIRDEMGLDVAGTLCFQLGGGRRSMTWRQFILALGLHTVEEMAEDGFRAYWLGSV